MEFMCVSMVCVCISIFPNGKRKSDSILWVHINKNKVWKVWNGLLKVDSCGRSPHTRK